MKIIMDLVSRGSYSCGRRKGSGMVFDGDVRWLPVRTAAKTLGVSMTRVYQLIEDGILVSIKVDKTVLVSARSCNARQLEMMGEGTDAC
jgi:hypothetical protein